MNDNFKIYLFLLIGLFGVSACNDAITLDTDLLAADEANIIFKDDFNLSSQSLTEDSILVYTSSTVYSKYPVGTIDDPIFGETTSSIFGQVRLLSPILEPKFPATGFDSVVLSLAYSDAGIYGDDSETYELDIFQLEEELYNDSTYYSNQSFETGMTPLGTISFVPKPQDSVFVNIYRDGFLPDSLYRRVAQERIKLDIGFSQEFLDADTLINDIILQELKGLHIKPKSVNGGMLAFDLNSPESRLTLYYKDTTSLEELNLYFTDLSVKTLQVEHDYSVGTIEPFLGENAMQDSLAFTQGMAGPFVKVEIPDITDLGNIIVNKAELEFFIADIDNPADDFAPNEQLILLEEVDNARVLVEDAVLGVTFSNLSAFGGMPIQDGTVQKYRMNISSHVQDMINGTAGSSLFIQPFPKPTDFARVVLYGANHSTYPIKLKLTYTQLQ